MELKVKKPNLKFDRTNIKKPNLNFNFPIVITLIKKELRSYFSSPLAYIVLSLFVVIVSIIFFGVFQYLKFGTADLTQLFTAIAFSFIIIIPALTMSSISRERQNGTIEFMLTQPLSEVHFLLGKFLAYNIILIALLILTIPIALVVSSLGQLDFGQVAMQYLGAYILGTCFISVGIAVSAYFKSEIAALLISLLISVAFILVGSQFLNIFPLILQSFFSQFSLLTHYQSISRGVIDLRDILYFAAFILSFLALAYFAIVKDKFPIKHKYLRNSLLATLLIIVIAFIIGALGQFIPGRIDFTSNKKYTVSEATKNVLRTLQDIAQVNFYASSNLPLEFQTIKREVEDLLKDYAMNSGGKLQINYKDPQTDAAAKEEADTDGLTELIFAVDSTDSVQRVNGYLGLSIKYLDKTEILNITNDISQDMDYQITKRLKKISIEDKIDIAFLNNNISQSRLSSYRYLNTELSEIYDVSDLTLTKDSLAIPAGLKVIIIAGPNGVFDAEAIQKLKEFYVNGGSIVLLTDTIELSPETGEPAQNANSLRDLFADFGVVVDENFVYDLKNNNIVGIAQGGVPVSVNYPLWFIAQSTEHTQEVLPGVTNISELWGSSITINKLAIPDNVRVYDLFQTSDESNIQNMGAISITVETDFDAQDSDTKRNVAVAIENALGGRAVVVGDSDFLTDDILTELSARQQGLDALNSAFGIGSVEWAAKDNQLSGIKGKNRLPLRVAIGNEQTASLIGGGVAFPILIVAALGGSTFYSRRKIQQKVY